MKRSLVTLLLANLALTGCGSDSNSSPQTPVEPGVPVETVPLEQATSIQLLNPESEGVTGTVRFNLATEEGVAVTGLEHASLAYVGFPVPTQWDHINDSMGLPWHQAQIFHCNDSACAIEIHEEQPGSYTLIPVGFNWVSDPANARASLSLADLAPVWIESTLP